MRNFFLITVLVFIANIAPAQWSSDPGVNLQICDTAGEQILSKIGITSDGGCYIGWFDSRNESYAVYLQRLNAQGIKQFPGNGLLISDHAQSSSLVDWDLAVDDSNCCVLAFTDERAGGEINPYAYRISPSGQFLWGPDGIALTDSIDVYQANPKVIVTSDGNIVIPWQYNNKIAMQKLNKAGNKLWGNIPKMVNGNPSINEKFNYPIGIKSDNGSIILYWIGYTGSFLNPQNFKTYTQKYSSTGAGLWGNPQDTVFNLGSAQGSYQPQIYSDGNNGAVYVWQSFVGGPTNCYVQRKTSSGQILFPANGSTVSAVNSFLRFAPTASVMQSTNNTYVFWQQKNSTQSQIGVYGQLFSATGDRLWGDSGKVFKPMDNNSFSGLITYSCDTNVMAYYAESLFGSSNGLIKAFKIDKSGNMLWGGNIITPASCTSSKSKLAVKVNQNKMSILSFNDGRSTTGIYAQNINYDGTFGNATGIINPGTVTPDKFELYQNYPNPFNPATGIKFSISANSNVTLKIFDVLGKEVETLVSAYLTTGTYKVDFNASRYSSGVYFYKLTAGNFSDVKKMLLVK